MNRSSFKGLVVLVVLAMFAGSSVASAQELEETKDMAGSLDSYLDMYWGQKRNVKVIQKRLFQKEGRTSLTFGGGVIPNDEFFIYMPIGMKSAYYLSEDLAIEFYGSYIFDTNSDLENFLNDAFYIQTTTPQVLRWMSGVSGNWSPIHGKIGILNTKLFHFDVFLALGVGAVGTDIRTREEGGATKHRVDVAGNVGGGIQVSVHDLFAVRLDYRHHFFAAIEEIGGVSMPAELTLGFVWFVN